ncbi:uncharacterized protein LOC115462756 isoform X2 [Microcaecilia unicolor]|uniref:Uncharacterized protein LOC115462756 isoform X2 n=1 Tax=Microcaecilia unicolor TaxID=1415580 RepID=A0A6P7X809_9AMPH|nr:uncharacterized protein LOC115462756 isoform X2 [Microcaecilia unicolor]
MPRGHCWSPEEVRLLLARIGHSGGVRLLMASTSRPNEALWRDICGELAARGYPRNVAQCRAKWKKMKQAFYSEREARRQGQGRPQGLCSPRHYGLLRRLWKQAGRPVFGERRLPDAKDREVQTGRHLNYYLSSPEAEIQFQKSLFLGSEENQSSANEDQVLSPVQRTDDPLERRRSPSRPEVQMKEENGEESDLSLSDFTPAGEITSGGEQEMSDLSDPVQMINCSFGRERSPGQSESIVSHRTADASTSPPHRQLKTEPQSYELRVKKEEVKEDEEEESNLSLSSTTPAWDITSLGEQDLSNLSYPEYPISQETAGISPLSACHRLKTEPLLSSCSAEILKAQMTPFPLSHSSSCFPTIPIINSVTSFVPSLSIKQENTEKEADAPPEHGASPAAGAGTTLGNQAAAADMQGGSVVSLLQSMQQILTQLLHTSQQQQVLLESLANDTVSHLNLISDNLLQVGETLQEMLLKAHHRNQVE